MQVVFSGCPSPPSPTVFSFVLTRDHKYEPNENHRSQDAASTDGQTVSEGLGEMGAKSIDRRWREAEQPCFAR